MQTTAQKINVNLMNGKRKRNGNDAIINCLSIIFSIKYPQNLDNVRVSIVTCHFFYAVMYVCIIIST